MGGQGPAPRGCRGPARPSPARRLPSELQGELTPASGLRAGALGPPSPARYGGRPVSPQLRGRRLAGLRGPCCPTPSLRVLGLGVTLGRMSPWSWFLLPTLCLLPTGADPRRSAPASSNCELKPQVRRASRAGEAVSPRYLHRPAKNRALGSRATSPDRAFLMGSPFWRGSKPPGRMRPCPQPSPLGRAAKESPSGVSWVSPVCFAGFRGRRAESLRRPSGAGTVAHLLWKFVLPCLPQRLVSSALIEVGKAPCSC